jgi:transposase InsO family protein
MIRHPCPPSQTWRTFLANHVDGLASIDLFVVPTATFRVLYAFVVLRHERRKVVHFNVTAHPTANWLAQQLVEAFPWETAPRYLIRDRDAAFGPVFRSRLDGMGILEVLTAPRSPWQNAYVERVIGSIRRECLDHVIVLNARHLRRILSSYFDYYHRSRTHLSLGKDCPEPRERLSLSHKSAAFISDTNGSLPDPSRDRLRHCRGRSTAPRELIPVALRRAFPNPNLPFRRRTHKAWQPADRRSELYPPQRHG